MAALTALVWCVASGASAQGAVGLSAPRPAGVSAPVPTPPRAATPPGYQSDDAAAGDDDGGPRYPSVREGGEVDAPVGSQLPSRLATRLRVLSTDLTALSGRGGNHIVDGVLSSLSGVLSIALGFKEPHPLDTYLFLWGSANIGRGIIDLALTPSAATPAVTYAHMPSGTLDEARVRLTFGEQALERLATRTRLARILDSSINIAVGVAVVPIFLGPNDFAIEDPLDYFVLIGSGISVVSGLINLTTRSAAERRWTAYRDLRERLEHGEDAAADPEGEGQLSFGGGPLPGGGHFSVVRTF